MLITSRAGSAAYSQETRKRSIRPSGGVGLGGGEDQHHLVEVGHDGLAHGDGAVCDRLAGQLAVPGEHLLDGPLQDGGAGGGGQAEADAVAGHHRLHHV